MMLQRRLVVISGLFLLAPRIASSQCAEPHYRWSEKTDDSLASVTTVGASITTMLKSWGVPKFTGEAKYRCANRAGRERRVYSLRAGSGA
jgi:hypothetical protein